MAGIVANARGEFGRVTNRNQDLWVSFYTGVITANIPNATINDIYISTPMEINTPDVYTVSVYLRQVGNGGQANFTLVALNSLDSNNIDISLGAIEMYSTVDVIRLLRFPNISIACPGQFALKIAITGKNGGSSGYFMNIGEIAIVHQ